MVNLDFVLTGLESEEQLKQYANLNYDNLNVKKDAIFNANFLGNLVRAYKNKRLILDLVLSKNEKLEFGSLMDKESLRVFEHNAKKLQEHGIFTRFFDSTTNVCYPHDVYVKSNKKMEQVVEEIENLNVNGEPLSNYEKYLAVCSHMFKHKYIAEEKTDSAVVSRGVIDAFIGDKLVCVGMSNMFVSILKRLGIPATNMIVCLHNKNKENDVSAGWHCISNVYIKDEKYDLDGIFSADPTYMASNKNYNFSLMSPADMEEYYKHFANCSSVDVYSTNFQMNEDENFYKLINQTSMKCRIKWSKIANYFNNKYQKSKSFSVSMDEKQFYSMLDYAMRYQPNVYPDKRFIEDVKKIAGYNDVFKFIDTVKGLYFNIAKKYPYLNKLQISNEIAHKIRDVRYYDIQDFNQFKAVKNKEPSKKDMIEALSRVLYSYGIKYNQLQESVYEAITFRMTSEQYLYNKATIRLLNSCRNIQLEKNSSRVKVIESDAQENSGLLNSLEILSSCYEEYQNILTHKRKQINSHEF